jgi:carbamoyltransferase
MKILGLHAGKHDGSVCVVEDGEVVYYQEEERLSRKKKDHLNYHCLKKFQNQKFDVIILGNSTSYAVTKKITLECLKEFNITSKEFFETPEHHLLHACSAYYNSPFNESFVFVADGAGMASKFDKTEREIVSLYFFKKNKVKVVYKIWTSLNPRVEGKNIFVNTLSLGDSFTAVQKTYGMKEPGAVMALGAYVKSIKPLLILQKTDLAFQTFYNPILLASKNNFSKALTSSDVQKSLEVLVFKFLDKILQKEKNLCLSGGVFQNCALNGLLLKANKNIFVDPISHDGGQSVGAAQLISNKKNYKKKPYNTMYLGDAPDYTAFDLFPNKRKTTYKEVASLIAENNVVGIYQGRNEAGPRALGNRSLLFDPRDPFAKEKMNLVKDREWFRPYAGTVLWEKRNDWFEMCGKSETPFMSYNLQVKNRDILGITHVDFTCRAQTLKKEHNPNFYRLIEEFEAITNVPIVLNTSMNFAGEPLVQTPIDAIKMQSAKNRKVPFIFFPELEMLTFIP